MHCPIARLAEDIERTLRTRVQANLYASWTGTEGFGVHWDDHDTVVVQLDGSKHWRLYGTTRPFPLYRDVDQPDQPPQEPVADLVLNTGDVLYVPRGVWHAVAADQGTRSLHVTCGLQTHTPTDLVTWACEQLLGHEEWRRDLPQLASPAEQAEALHGRVTASAPLHGGELVEMVDKELVSLIRPGLAPAQACLLATASCPGVTSVLVSASSASHWQEAADVLAEPPLDIARLREITGVLASA